MVTMARFHLLLLLSLALLGCSTTKVPRTTSLGITNQQLLPMAPRHKFQRHGKRITRHKDDILVGRASPPDVEPSKLEILKKCTQASVEFLNDHTQLGMLNHFVHELPSTCMLLAARGIDAASGLVTAADQLTNAPMLLYKLTSFAKAHPKASAAAGGVAVLAGYAAHRRRRGRRRRQDGSDGRGDAIPPTRAKTTVFGRILGRPPAPSTSPAVGGAAGRDLDARTLKRPRRRRRRRPFEPLRIAYLGRDREESLELGEQRDGGPGAANGDGELGGPEPVYDGAGSITVGSGTESAELTLKGTPGSVVRFSNMPVSGLGNDVVVLSTPDTPTTVAVPLRKGETREVVVTYCPPGWGIDVDDSLKFKLTLHRISSSAYLQSLVINPSETISIDPKFSPNTKKYAVSVPEDVKSITLNLTAQESGGRVSIGNSVIAGSYKRFGVSCQLTTEKIVLAPGPNNLKVTVQSEDRMNRETYSFRVVRKPRKLTFNSAAIMVPREDKKKRGGEDAFALFSADGNAISSGNVAPSPSMPSIMEGGYEASLKEVSVLAVSDGVSAWDSLGVDAGLYAKELMENLVESARANLNDQKRKQKKGALDLLTASWQKTNSKGSATVAVATLDETTLTAAIVGDSRFLVIREGQIHFISPKQEMEFNTPYQIANPDVNPEDLDLQTPRDAKKITLRGMRPGDIVIVATDGLFDNVFLEKIRRIAEKAVRLIAKEQLAGVISRTLMQQALENSKTVQGDTPWSRAAQEEVMREVRRIRREDGIDIDFEVVMGGKPDDICIVVAVVESA